MHVQLCGTIYGLKYCSVQVYGVITRWSLVKISQAQASWKGICHRVASDLDVMHPAKSLFKVVQYCVLTRACNSTHCPLQLCSSLPTNCRYVSTIDIENSCTYSDCVSRHTVSVEKRPHRCTTVFRTEWKALLSKMFEFFFCR